MTKISQGHGYISSTALRYEFPLLLTLSTTRYSGLPHKRVQKWRENYDFFSSLKNVVFQGHPYHYCALVSNCTDHAESVAKRYKWLSSLSPKEIVLEHEKVFGAKFPKNFHIDNKDFLLNCRNEYCLLASLTPRLWDEVLESQWHDILEPIVEAKASEISSMLEQYSIRKVIEEYTKLHYKRVVHLHPSWAQFGGMVFNENSQPAISIYIHEEDQTELLRVLIHESLHILFDQEKYLSNKSVIDSMRQLTKKLESQKAKAEQHYTLIGLNYVTEAFTEATCLRILNLNIDSLYRSEKFPLLQPTFYKALIDVYEESGETLIEILPRILEQNVSRL